LRFTFCTSEYSWPPSDLPLLPPRYLESECVKWTKLEKHRSHAAYRKVWTKCSLSTKRTGRQSKNSLSGSQKWMTRGQMWLVTCVDVHGTNQSEFIKNSTNRHHMCHFFFTILIFSLMICSIFFFAFYILVL
jgi:hypothetical protein